jgi:hypothetical protein
MYLAFGQKWVAGHVPGAVPGAVPQATVYLAFGQSLRPRQVVVLLLHDADGRVILLFRPRRAAALVGVAL